jgi:hypothetical protein
VSSGRPARLPRGRVALLAAGGAALIAGLSTGLARAGIGGTPGPAAAHGILMVLGFLGTLIALERAVALRARWSYLGPACSGVATVLVLAGAPPVVGGALFATAGLLVTAVYVATLRRHVETHLVLMAAGALLWVGAAALWAAGWSVVRVTPLLAGFLVFTIVGERLELSRLRVPSAAARRPLLGAAGLFGVGIVLTLVSWRIGLVVAGAGLWAQTAWLTRHDVARVTIRRAGLPRFAAACMLAGYVWLAVGGALWITMGLGVGGALVWDAALHAIFLGFVMSMVMGHAPIILPAVLRTALPYRHTAWLPLGLLHLSLTLRVAADLAGSTWLRGWAAGCNVAALLAFVLITAATVVRARPRPRLTPASPAAPATALATAAVNASPSVAFMVRDLGAHEGRRHVT